MTAIAAKRVGNDWHFACDSRITSDDVKTQTLQPKWVETRGHFMAFAGNCADVASLTEWVSKCGSSNLASAINSYLAEEELDVAVLLHKRGDALVYYCSMGYAHAEAEMVTAGSGEGVAWGAMAAGATPLEAVQAAGKRLWSVGPPYYELSRPIRVGVAKKGRQAAAKPRTRKR